MRPFQLIKVEFKKKCFHILCMQTSAYEWDYFIEHLKLLLVYRFMDESEWSVPASLHGHYLALSWLTYWKSATETTADWKGVESAPA